MSDNGNNNPPEDEKTSEEGQQPRTEDSHLQPLNIRPVRITEQLKTAFINYAMSVIVDRALPDVRDGLKPVHRRCLFSMYMNGYDSTGKTVKSAKVVGDVIGKYHPHGDTSAYDTLVRMAQNFSLRYPLVIGQGNFGNLDGDKAAAMRYTEIKMARIANEMVEDLGPRNDFKETVDQVPNYDGSEMMPSVMPNRFPNLLVNGSSGIAVGMATNIPSHNLREIIDATIALIDDPNITIDGLMKFVPGPDFPTGGIIYGVSGVREAYETGRGSIIIRSRTHIEGKPGEKQCIVIDEIPYNVNKKELVTRINACIREKTIEGLTEVNDYSGRNHDVRVVIGIRKGEAPEILLNQLFKRTNMQISYGINMLALNDGHPEVMNLKQILEAFVKHRREVITRRTVHDLKRSRAQAHILEGMLVVLSNIDEVIRIIRESANKNEAKIALMNRGWDFSLLTELIARAADGSEICRPEDLEDPAYGIHDNLYHLSDRQTESILNMPLHRLTGMEYNEVQDGYKDLVAKIRSFLEILENDSVLVEVIRKELREIRDTYGDDRRSEIQGERPEITMEDLIVPETAVITMSRTGYVKYQPLAEYREQKRGGRGKRAAKVKDEDVIDNIYIVNTHDTILCFSSIGKVYPLKVYELPSSSSQSKGLPIVNLLPLEENERIISILPVDKFDEDRYLMLITKRGLIKKTSLALFKNLRKTGILAIKFMEGDTLAGSAITAGKDVIGVFASNGYAAVFNEYYGAAAAEGDEDAEDDLPDTEEAGDADDADEADDDASAAQEKDISSYWNPAPDAKGIRPSGRASRGVRAIKLAPGAEVVSMVVFKQDAGMVLTVSSSGLGKLTPLSRYRLCNRNCKGVISIKLTQHNGKQAQVVGVLQAQMNDQIVLITSDGILIRTKVEQIRVCGRFSQGVKLINIGENSELIAVEKVLGEDLENDAEIRGLNAPEGEAGAASGEVPENSAGENPAGETAGENDAEAAPSDAAEAQPETGDPATQE